MPGVSGWTVVICTEFVLGHLQGQTRLLKLANQKMDLEPVSGMSFQVRNRSRKPNPTLRYPERMVRPLLERNSKAPLAAQDFRASMAVFPEMAHRATRLLSHLHLAVNIRAAHFASGHANAFLVLTPARFHHKGLTAEVTDGQAAGER
jgi:hypothetical protein